MTRDNRKSKPLQCFDYKRYILTYDGTDPQCIARTRQGSRCLWDISEEELDEVISLNVEAKGIEIGDERHSILQRLVLLRTCGDFHRQKLEAHPECLDGVAKMYGENIHMSTISVIRSAGGSQDAGQPPAPRRDSSIMTNINGVVRHRYLLRPRVGDASDVMSDQLSLGSRQAIFVPYASDPKDNINDILLSDVPSNYISTGHVYAFIWPSSPEFVKIGYTGKSVSSRILSWQECHPGSILLHSVAFAFPQRMERLVHLQMSTTRHQIIICTHCSGTHFEWFKVSTCEAIQTINAWKELTERDELYSATGKFSERWQKRTAGITDKITARALLSVAEMEAKPVNSDMKSVAPSVDLIEAGMREDSVTAADTICPLRRRVDSTLPKKSSQPDWDTILASFSDFVRMVKIHLP